MKTNELGLNTVHQLKPEYHFAFLHLIMYCSYGDQFGKKWFGY